MLQHFINAFRKGYTVDVDVVTDFLIVNIFASVHNMSMFLTFGVQGIKQLFFFLKKKKSLQNLLLIFLN